MTNNKQQTAVGSIIEFCKNKMFMEASVHQVIYLSLIKFCEEQAKEMEKEQIRKAYCDGEHYKDTKLTTDYYEQTYGGGEQ